MGLLVHVYRAEMGLKHYCSTQFRKGKLLESQGVFRSRHVEGENVNLNDNAQADRRHSDRFPIEREVRYRVLNKRSSEETGDGKTVNISSSGVLFTVRTYAAARTPHGACHQLAGAIEQ